MLNFGQEIHETMSMFQCLTCMETLGAEAMMKHLSLTRHKTIVDAFSEEEVVCEECQNSNVHQLQIIRFGGEDISLLCNGCLQKEYKDSERPTTAYSLSNGSFLKYWDTYKKVRNCACENCGNESNLNVNHKGKVICDKCLKSLEKLDAEKYISEKSGRFLYVYLGIKEPSSTRALSKKGGRKIGRRDKNRGASKQGKPREKKPLTVHQQIAKQAYTIKQQNNTIESDSNVSLRSFKGINADNISSASTGRANRSTVKDRRGNNVVAGKKDDRKSSKMGGTASHFKVPKSHERPSKNPVKSSKTVKNIGAKAPTGNNTTERLNSKGGSQRNAAEKYHASEDASREIGGSSSKLDKKVHVGNKNKQQKIFSSKPGASVNGKSRERPVKHATKQNNPRSVKESAEIQKPRKTKSVKHENNQHNPDKTKENKNADKPGNSKSDQLHKDNRKSMPVQAGIGEKGAVSSKEEIEEGEVLRKYTKYVPKMSYPDLDTYFNEFSYALFLEEKLESDFIEEFQMIWPKSEEEKVFVINMKATNNPALEKLMPPELLKLGRLPFTKRQPLILVSNDESDVWYAYVREAALKKNTVTILLELYPWNRKKLPTRQSSLAFKLLPCSAQTNRIFFAMTSVKNPKFIDLILGQKPVKQIHFHNRLQFTKETFNESQKSAIQHVLNNSVTILQGPPGTGKTSTIEEIIIQMIKNFNSFPILCVAASNIAIDNIAEKFMENWPEIKILRILSDGKEQQYNNEHPLGEICLHNIVNKQLPPDMKEIIFKLRSGRAREVSKNQYNKLLTCQNDISDRHVLQAQILFTTNIAAGGRQLKALKELPVVIMDESTQSSEASTLVPLSLPGIRTFVFVGDQKQLSSFSNIPQLQMSLFERVLLNGCYTKPHMLDTQYRMHPTISEFPIKKFYNGELKNGVSCEQKQRTGIEYPLFFYQCNNGEESKVFSSRRGMRGFTYNNRHEGQEILKILYKLILDKGVKADEIGVITPYSAQRDLLSEMIVNDIVINPKKMAMEQEIDEADVLDPGLGRSNGSKKNTINIINGLFVSTIDSFQGHEKNFIIFSCVRNNKENKIGFVSDRRRMNVALTRAKNGLVLVGNKVVLAAGDPLWCEYVQYLEEKGLIFDSLDSY